MVRSKFIPYSGRSGGETIVAGLVADYLARPNAGVIEFLTVAPLWRRQGIGGRMLAALEERLEADAHRGRSRPLDYIIAEMNDPFLTDATADNLDPFVRAGIWHRWNYRLIEFPYLQPALSAEQRPIRTLCLIAKPCNGASADTIDAGIVHDMAHEYIRWAMRIDKPDDAPEFASMAAFLKQRSRVRLLNLADYCRGGER